MTEVAVPHFSAVPFADRLKVLVIAYYFPPLGLSGVQRVAKFVKYLPQFGWEPIVLTVDPTGYYAFDHSLEAEILAEGIEIHRVKSVDLNRFFGKQQLVPMPKEGIRKRWSKVSQALMIPDSKIGWKKEALQKAYELFERHKFDLVFSSAPPFTNHLIGAEISRTKKIPLITDFREPWLPNPRHYYPFNSKAKHEKLEKEVVAESENIVVLNRKTKDDFLKRHLGHNGFKKVHILPHGFDPSDFLNTVPPRTDAKLQFLYSGMFYDVQQPDTFLQALAEFLRRRPEAKPLVEAHFIGLFPEAKKELVQQLQLQEVVQIEGYKEHQEAVTRLRQADVLWMTLGDSPGSELMNTSKLYEYFGTGKPILGLVAPSTDEADALQEYEAGIVVPPLDVPAVAQAIEIIYDQWRNGSLPVPNYSVIEKYNRRDLTMQLAKLFTSVLQVK